MIPNFSFTAQHKTLLADMLTPMGIYLSVRDTFPTAILLTCNDPQNTLDKQSYIACQPIAGFQLKGEVITTYFPGGKQSTALTSLTDQLDAFVHAFKGTDTTGVGLFGYTCFDAARHLDDFFADTATPIEDVPTVRYDLYRYVVTFNHHHHTLTLSEYNVPLVASQFESFEKAVRNTQHTHHPFSLQGEEQSYTSDRAFLANIKRAKKHCFHGDIFQLVLSRRFSRPFQGDDFNVYRALCVINPSPYLFYFDYVDFTVFGASPEPHLKVKERKASVFPIAGTFLRTDDQKKNQILTEKLLADKKENAEHYMLVDLVRNDLSKHCDNVQVTALREVIHFSHVMHMVSQVQADLKADISPYGVLADCFPAATLTGAPKRRAIGLIWEIEAHRRGLYGGAIGYMDWNGTLNHAIIIRSFVSKGQHLTYQGGAGIVAHSQDAHELQEVHNKLQALREALVYAETLTS